MSNDNSKSKGSHDSGWNDPPMFLYGATPPSAAGKSKLNLNKRVAFPLQSSGTNSPATVSKAPLALSGLPLPFAGSTIIPPTNFSSTPIPSITDQKNILPPPSTIFQPIAGAQEITNSNLNDLKPNESQLYITKILDRTIASLALANKTNELNEIIKRIDIMKSSYDNLEPQIQIILYNIANSIDQNNILEATNLHRSLVVDHLKMCSQWAPALRQIIILLAEPNNDTKQNKDQSEMHVPLYSSNESVEVLTSPPVSQHSNAQNSNAKHNFAKIFHV